MRYKTIDIGELGLDLDLSLDAAFLEQHLADLEGKLAPEGLHFHGRLEPLGEDFLLRGKLKGALEFTCVRCLEPTKLPIDVDLAVSFVEAEADKIPHGKVPQSGETVDLSEGDPGDFAVFQDGVIDLAPEFREELFLAVPYSPRCEPECLGICPHCGTNRDKSPCNCEEQQSLKRSPFADLAKKLKS